MSPTIPPSIVALVCGKSRTELAKIIQVSRRTMYRLLVSPWSEWKVDLADKFCAACGFNFFALDVSDRIQSVNWSSDTQRVTRAIEDVIKASGRKATKERVAALAQEFKRLSGQGE